VTVVVASAPVRICDLGGWTDTWFAKSGAVCNIAVSPRAEVRLEAHPDHGGPMLAIHAEGVAGPHPLIEAAVAEIGLPDGVRVELDVRCEAPPGSATGTSAAVAVAAAAAVSALSERHRQRSPYELAMAAHRAEYVRCQRQCGVQDHLAAACGGISWIEIDRFPHASVTSIAVPAGLEEALRVVLLGRHDSSAVHEAVIAALSADAAPLERLRRCASDGRDALVAGDLAAFGRAMIANTEAQADLHPALVSAAARQVIEIARAAGALGWKVNGAGGEGGSVTLLGGDATALAAAGLATLPVAISDGLRISRSRGAPSTPPPRTAP
jgi:D-glycero-alpha-D-manno-heptose-7-phosphate kinase